LVDVLDRAPTGGYEGALQRQSAMNNAALIFAYLGETSRASEICEYQLTLVAEAMRVHQDPESSAYLTMAIDPWVNLGRLLAMRGDAEAATSHFADIFALRSGADRRLGPCAISADAWLAARSTDLRLDEVTEAVYVTDSLKALFSAGKFSAAAEFVKALSWTHTTSLRWLAAEAKIIALAGLKRHEEILAETAAEPDDATLYVKAIFTQHNIESRVELGDDHAGRLATGLAVLLLSGALDQVPAASFMRFTARCGNVLQLLAERPMARAVRLRGLEIARQLRDQPGEWGFLCALRDSTDPPTSRHEWDAAHRELLSRCHYRSVRAAENLPLVPSAELDPVYEKLLDSVRATAAL
jgi:hypothetical protein